MCEPPGTPPAIAWRYVPASRRRAGLTHLPPDPHAKVIASSSIPWGQQVARRPGFLPLAGPPLTPRKSPHSRAAYRPR